MLPGYPESTICVQRFDDSLNSAIHTTYRNWLRSSSMHEPRDPPLEVVMCLNCVSNWTGQSDIQLEWIECFEKHKRQTCGAAAASLGCLTAFEILKQEPPHKLGTVHSGLQCVQDTEYNGNDPSAGSPTETLLRLLLPLNDQVWTTFRQSVTAHSGHDGANQKFSLNHSIGSSDGRCVQRAGT